MCLACLELRKLFNYKIIKAQDSGDKGLESRLRGRRETFLRDIYEQEHLIAEQLFFNFDNSKSSNDSDVLDGKKWEDHLEESFKNKEELIGNMPELSSASPGQWRDLWAADSDQFIKETLNSVLKGRESIEVPEIKAESKSEMAKNCDHSWMDYLGAGTLATETICRDCGIQKP